MACRTHPQSDGNITQSCYASARHDDGGVRACKRMGWIARSDHQKGVMRPRKCFPPCNCNGGGKVHLSFASIRLSRPVPYTCTLSMGAAELLCTALPPGPGILSMCEREEKNVSAQ
eukprot:1161049-Pelagomonas_calceolata.AAC.9